MIDVTHAEVERPSVAAFFLLSARVVVLAGGVRTLPSSFPTRRARHRRPRPTFGLQLSCTHTHTHTNTRTCTQAHRHTHTRTRTHTA
eukprot:5434436-Pleurochrysis_carterae.AAC.2